MAGTIDTINVLHVDDEPEFADLTATFLEREDDRFEIETATSASEALAEFAISTFDCIVSDHDMPSMNGIEFLEAVREEHPDLPFILYTGKGSEEVASDAITAGVTDYLQKESGTDHYTLLANRIGNVVESRRSQQKLAERDRDLRRYKHMINSMYESACLYDEHGRFEIVNEYLANWYNTTREALEGEESNLIRIIQEEAETGDPYQALLNGRRDQLSGEIEAEFPNHGYAVLEYRLTPLTIDGTVEGVVGVTRDITAQKQHQRELEQTNALLSTLFDALPQGVLVEDESRNVLAVNQQLFRLFELPGSSEGVAGADCERVAEDLSDMFADSEQFVERINELITEREQVDGEELTLADGRTFERTHRPIELLDGGGHLWVYRDVTARKVRERELSEQNDRLEEFASIVSHDLRNPITVAEGHLELAATECDSEHLEHVEYAHERMRTLIEDLLTLAREGETVTDFEAVALTALVEVCWANVETDEATLVTDTERTVQADKNRLKQLFENLIRNAIEHGDGDVTVTVGETDTGFYVEDDGPGIPADEREVIFEAGYSTRADGTGFGLSIVIRIVEAHEWEINVTDGDEGGARFEITGVEFGTE